MQSNCNNGSSAGDWFSPDTLLHNSANKTNRYDKDNAMMACGRRAGHSRREILDYQQWAFSFL